MIHFIDSARDGELLAELKDESVLAPDVIARIDESMGRPESGTLNDFLLAGADLIPEKAWLSWLIRRHGCHRFGHVAWLDEAAAWAGGGVPPEGNLPVRRCVDGGILLAVLRPDRLPATVRWLIPTVPGQAASRLHLAAATLREMRKLRSAWETHPESDSVTPLSVLPDRICKMDQRPVGLPQRCG
jgi:hypothetical protein